MVKASVAAKDLEAGGGRKASTTKHYVPVLELFRGHWFGILVQMCYEACECCSSARQRLRIPCSHLTLFVSWALWEANSKGDY